MWFGQLLAALDFKGRGSWANLRWYEEAPQSQRTTPLQLTRLRWLDHERTAPGSNRRERLPFCDLVHLDDIIEPVFIQPDCSVRAGAAPHFLYNHRVR